MLGIRRHFADRLSGKGRLIGRRRFTGILLRAGTTENTLPDLFLPDLESESETDVPLYSRYEVRREAVDELKLKEDFKSLKLRMQIEIIKNIGLKF